MEESRFYITPFTCLLTGPFQPHSSWGHRLSFNPSRPGKRIYLYVPEQMAKCSQHFCLLSALAFHGSCFPAPPPPYLELQAFFCLSPALKLGGTVVKARQPLSEEPPFNYLFGNLCFWSPFVLQSRNSSVLVAVLFWCCWCVFFFHLKNLEVSVVLALNSKLLRLFAITENSSAFAKPHLCAPLPCSRRAEGELRPARRFFTPPGPSSGFPPSSPGSPGPERGAAGTRWSPPAALRSGPAAPPLPAGEPAVGASPACPSPAAGSLLRQPKGFKGKVRFRLIRSGACHLLLEAGADDKRSGFKKADSEVMVRR